ncbi:hypothetical protein SBOR_7766 [Sclerotinia borealis F-4128]|uniref:Uncharacterized protein n=1 Tax=Sclerotinia borealis (strain F-4128) TaxID=1432307 RepID=W9CBF4_SCLBF|nr:hypothetical protein SBOR_7766 [Sclerotinia borealis F-4128]
MNIIQQPLSVTPSENFTDQPLTPPPTGEKTTQLVFQILQEIKNRRAGRSYHNETWLEYKLKDEEYVDLLRLIESNESLRGFCGDKLRLTHFHAIIISEVVTELTRQLDSIASSESPSAEFAQEINLIGSTTIGFEDPKYSKHDPDAQFLHSGARYPGVVLEVSNSRKRKDLKRLAEDYIYETNGDIRFMIGIDIDYRGSKEATLSVWQPQIIANDAGEMESSAIKKKGHPNESAEAGLRLPLQEFATKSVVELYGPINDELFISAATLFAYVEEGEEEAALVDQRKGIVMQEKLWVRKRRRSITPEEELDEKREKSFRRDEQEAQQREAKDDSSY